eukprot:359980-Chlamydomonas_euryale.AAC.2
MNCTVNRACHHGNALAKTASLAAPVSTFLSPTGCLMTFRPVYILTDLGFRTCWHPAPLLLHGTLKRAEILLLCCVMALRRMPADSLAGPLRPHVWRRGVRCVVPLLCGTAGGATGRAGGGSTPGVQVARAGALEAVDGVSKVAVHTLLL